MTGADVAVPPPTHRPEEADTRAPDGSEIRLLVGREHGATRASLCEVVLPAGKVSRPVWHREVEEVWYILEGEGDVWRCPAGVAPKTLVPVRVQAGDALTIPKTWRFQFRASRRGALRFLCYTAPPWPGADEAQPAGASGLWPPNRLSRFRACQIAWR